MRNTTKESAEESIPKFDTDLASDHISLIQRTFVHKFVSYQACSYGDRNKWSNNSYFVSVFK